MNLRTAIDRARQIGGLVYCIPTAYTLAGAAAAWCATPVRAHALHAASFGCPIEIVSNGRLITEQLFGQPL